MKNSTWLSLLALLVAVAGLVVSLLTYFRKHFDLYDDLDDMLEDDDDYLDYADLEEYFNAADDKPAAEEASSDAE